ncbi:MAG: cadherin-like beta sandwich domain-containing protein, partial [Pedobacter sp.]|nr:cadherin-like beta sandwich domain-containing protein [Chitinophagaceae bacterium]
FPDDNFASEAWKGDMDDVRLWNTQRTQSQVQTNMNNELVGNESGLVAYYKLNQAIAGGTNTGWSIAFNAVSNTNNGTLNTFALSGATSNWVTGTVPSLAATADATLTSLTTTAGAISPTFAAATVAYTASVSNATTSVTVTPTKSDANANIQVRVNGGAYATINSGSASSALALNVGSNTIDVLITAQDGTTIKTYTLIVTRISVLGLDQNGQPTTNPSNLLNKNGAKGAGGSVDKNGRILN